MVFEPMSATLFGFADLRKVYATASERWEIARRALPLVHEVHRFNRAQQDFVLRYVEYGTIIVVAAITENPR